LGPTRVWMVKQPSLLEVYNGLFANAEVGPCALVASQKNTGLAHGLFQTGPHKCAQFFSTDPIALTRTTSRNYAYWTYGWSKDQLWTTQSMPIISHRRYYGGHFLF
jgi:hypothetical protein